MIRRVRSSLLRSRRYLARWIVGSAAAALAVALFTASALGVAFGPGETLPGKVLDGVAAVPRVFADLGFYWNVVAHPVRTAEAVHHTYERLEWARQHLPEPEEVEEGVRSIDRNTLRLRHGSTMIREGVDSILRLATLNPLDGSLPVSSSLVTIRTGVANLPRPDSFQVAVRRGAEVARATRAVLESLPYEETYAALRTALGNLADNFEPDERAVTVLLVLLALACAAASPPAAHYWIRRGRPGLVAGWIMRRGMRRWPDEYVEEMKGWPVYERLREEILREADGARP